MRRAVLRWRAVMRGDLRCRCSVMKITRRLRDLPCRTFIIGRLVGALSMKISRDKSPARAFPGSLGGTYATALAAQKHCHAIDKIRFPFSGEVARSAGETIRSSAANRVRETMRSLPSSGPADHLLPQPGEGNSVRRKAAVPGQGRTSS